MSWQSYVDDQLLNTKMVTHAVICGHDGNIWAKSADFVVSFISFLYILLLFLCIFWKKPAGRLQPPPRSVWNFFRSSSMALFLNRGRSGLEPRLLWQLEVESHYSLSILIFFLCFFDKKILWNSTTWLSKMNKKLKWWRRRQNFILPFYKLTF